MHTMGEYFFCYYLWGVIYSMGNVIFKNFFADSCLVLKVCKVLFFWML